MEVPTLDFATQGAASGLLETVATTTVTVAGLAFSVTVVAFTLTAQQPIRREGGMTGRLAVVPFSR